MTCCIVAALIIGQILAWRDRIKQLFGWQPEDETQRLDPLFTPHLKSSFRNATIPTLAIVAVMALAYEHRAHLLAWTSLLSRHTALHEESICRAPIAQAANPALPARAFNAVRWPTISAPRSTVVR